MRNPGMIKSMARGAASGGLDRLGAAARAVGMNRMHMPTIGGMSNSSAGIGRAIRGLKRFL
jgi:hypothetical protein